MKRWASVLIAVMSFTFTLYLHDGSQPEFAKGSWYKAGDAGSTLSECMMEGGTFYHIMRARGSYVDKAECEDLSRGVVRFFDPSKY